MFGKTIGDFVAALGGTPVATAGSEQYGAYKRGKVDAGMTGVTAVVSRRLYEVTKHLTVTDHADVEFVVLINEGVWQGLANSERAVIAKARAAGGNRPPRQDGPTRGRGTRAASVAR